MVNSKASTSDESAAENGHGGATSETDIDGKDSKKGEAVDSLPPQLESSAFQVGEKVLALYDQRLYDAKVQGIHFQIEKWTYFVHYLGWKKSYDEWLGVERLMKYTEENLQKQQELKKKQELVNRASGERAVPLKAKASIGSRRKKQRTDSVQMEKGSPRIEKHTNIHIPPALKKLLITDWESRTHLGKLVKLPCSPTVQEILGNYRDYRLKEDGLLSVAVEEIVEGLRCYFDNALHAMLLYKNERQQFKEAIVGDLAPSAVYGAEHLLRLFVKLPEILQRANIEENMMTELQLTLADFLKFFEKCQPKLYPVTCLSEDLDLTSMSQEEK